MQSVEDSKRRLFVDYGITDTDWAAIAHLQEVIRSINVEKKWTQPSDIEGVVRVASAGEQLALIMGEAAEALEEVRKGPDCWELYEANEKPEGVVVELADIIIRVLDMAKRYELDLAEALAVKIQFNSTRPERHGGKVI